MKKLIILGAICSLVVTSCSSINAGEVVIQDEPTTSTTVEIVESEIIEDITWQELPVEFYDESSEIGTIEEEETTLFRVTAYCACEICCGQWALNRPIDEFGNPIVYGAANKPLTTGVSCASPLPFGTEVDLGDYGTVVVEDRTANWVVEKHGENIIDIYFDDHETARQFGLQYIEGVIK